jgi:HAD superfamily hydrolase (TIGR01509 family)
MKYDAILFDMDGTLVETTELYFRACRDAFQKLGHTLTPETYAEWYGKGWSIERWMRELAGPQEDVSKIRSLRDARYIELLSTESEYIPGSHDVLAATEEHPRAIITGSWRKYVNAIDSKLNITNHIDKIISADEMGDFMKPHPHGLLLACEMLGVKPEKCLMVGDQLFDIDAARALTMDSCLIWHTHTPKAAAGKATYEVDSVGHLLKHL